MPFAHVVVKVRSDISKVRRGPSSHYRSYLVLGAVLRSSCGPVSDSRGERSALSGILGISTGVVTT